LTLLSVDAAALYFIPSSSFSCRVINLQCSRVVLLLLEIMTDAKYMWESSRPIAKILRCHVISVCYISIKCVQEEKFGGEKPPTQQQQLPLLK
jgi:hypothetical protein